MTTRNGSPQQPPPDRSGGDVAGADHPPGLTRTPQEQGLPACHPPQNTESSRPRFTTPGPPGSWPAKAPCPSASAPWRAALAVGLVLLIGAGAAVASTLSRATNAAGASRRRHPRRRTEAGLLRQHHPRPRPGGRQPGLHRQEPGRAPSSAPGLQRRPGRHRGPQRRRHRRHLHRPEPGHQLLRQEQGRVGQHHRRRRRPAVRSWWSSRKSTPPRTSRARRSPPRSSAAPRTWRCAPGWASRATRPTRTAAATSPSTPPRTPRP